MTGARQLNIIVIYFTVCALTKLRQIYFCYYDDNRSKHGYITVYLLDAWVMPMSPTGIAFYYTPLG